MSNSSTKAKPAKPYPAFPLFAHANGHWAKKIRGKLHYFGRWDDPQAALGRYLERRDYLHAGRKPPVDIDGLTVAELCNRFLTSKRHLLDTRELHPRTFRDYYSACERIVLEFSQNRLVADLDATDFERLRRSIARTLGPNALGVEITRIKSVFKYAYDQGLIDKPVRYGQSFKKPNKAVLRKERAQNGSRMFEAHELRMLLDMAEPTMHTIVLLGVNCGYGQSDIAKIPIDVVRQAIETGWLIYARGKTGIGRRCPLWPETIQALKVVLETRPKPRTPEHGGRAFLTKQGHSWITQNGYDRVTGTFSRLLVKLDLKRPKLGFYALRHTFETIAGESKDQVSVDSLMGHADRTMGGVYRERISDERLVAVVNVVHSWLFEK